MGLLKRTWERRGITAFAFVITFIVMLALAYTVVSSRVATDVAIESVSEVYLRELGDQVIAHFNTGIEGRFCEAKAVGTSLSLVKPSTVEQARELLAAQQSNDDYAYLALLGDDGCVYTAEDIFEVSAAKQAGAEGTMSYQDSEGHEVLLYENVLILVDPIEPVSCGSVSFTAVVAGYDLAHLSEWLDLGMFDGGSRSSLMMRNGTCIVGCARKASPGGADIFSILEAKATLEGDVDIEQIRQAVARGETCLVPFSSGSAHEYLYLRPIDNSNWYLVTAMPVGVIDGDIATLSSVLVQNAAIVGCALLLAGVASFFVYSRLTKRNARLLAEEKNRAEEASERAQRASLAKSEFLSRMSHEIRTPMNGIMGMTAIARESLGDDAKVRVCLDKVSTTSTHLMALLNDILDMSKIESGKVEIRLEPFEFHSFVASFSAVFATQAADLSIHYQTEEIGKFPAWVLGDALRLNQIVYNLVGNAFKFTPREGHVTLRIERMAESPVCRVVDAEVPDAVRGDMVPDGAAEGSKGAFWVRISVIDTGCGIAPEHFGRIFSSFDQGDSDRARERGGTGLGLAITKRFAEMMGGRITLESEVGRGSTFMVEVPLTPAQEGASTVAQTTPLPTQNGDAAGERYDFSGKHILVVEDNELNREIAVEILTMTGAEVSTASTGAQALHTFEQSASGFFDFVLMDIQMPEMDGCEATRAIRALDRPDAQEVPIVAMTANAFVEDEERSRRCGMDSHLSKPLDIHLVYATIDRFLRDSSREDGAAD